MTPQQPTGVCVVLAQDLDALVALAEVAIEDGWLAGDYGAVETDIKAAIKRGRLNLHKRLAAVDNDRLIKELPVLCRIQDAS